MNELIKVSEMDGAQLVNARELYDALQVRRDFSNWIKNRIEKYGFIEGEDFFKHENLSSPNLANSKSENDASGKATHESCSPNLASKIRDNWGGHNKIDYLLTMDMAKELAMVENNEEGRKVRRNLIKIEKEYRQLRSGGGQLSLEVLSQLVEMKKEFRSRLDDAERAIEILRKRPTNSEMLLPVKDSHADMVRFGGIYLDITGKEGDYVEVRVAFKLFQHIQTVPLESHKFMIEIPYIFPEISLDRRSTRQPIFRGCLIK